MDLKCLSDATVRQSDLNHHMCSTSTCDTSDMLVDN
jgi:hypothetical protein